MFKNQLNAQNPERSCKSCLFSLFQVVALCQMSDSHANKSLNRREILLGDFVFDHFSALYHELDLLEFADVFERIACNSVRKIVQTLYERRHAEVAEWRSPA